VDSASGRTLVRVNSQFYRPAEVELLIGDAGKARQELGWIPRTTLEQLCSMMVKADLQRNEHGSSF
jgi:GDPmannose 4,6-dehydratase